MNGGVEVLVERCRAGDRGAWERLYRATAPTVGLFLQRLLGPTRDLDDLVQQVFVELFSSLHRYRGDGSLATWLYGIATNVAGRHLRFEFRRRRRAAAYAEWLESQAVSTPDPAAGAQARAVLRCVARVVTGLEVGQRAVYVMREWEGLSTSETAVALGVPEGTVRWRLCMARRAIADALAEDGLEGSTIGDRDELPLAVVRRIGCQTRHGG